MGNFYTNFTLRGPSQQDVTNSMRGRSAAITPVSNGCVVVFDEESDGQEGQVIHSLGAQLSQIHACSVLAVVNHDDDILHYQLFNKGELVDEYNSCPDYFEGSEEPSRPSGGDATKLCAAFGATNIAAVETILRKSSFDADGYGFELERHGDLVSALGLPAFAVGVGFNYFANGELPQGLDENKCVRTS
jgi:hypothetical protein